MSNTNNNDEILDSREMIRSEFARVLLMVHRAQQAENSSCGAYGPATVFHEFAFGSREEKAISGMRGHPELERNLSFFFDVESGIVRVNR